MNTGHGTSFALSQKPSTAFSTVSSAASATTAGTARSGGSRLLFGEIDTSSDRSSESFASVCSLVLSDSSTFLRFWLTDDCRERVLSNLACHDLASLRLVCHDFSVRAAPALFADLSITFKTSTFTKPARTAALDRLGFHVKTLKFKLPHTADTFLPPLVQPETGDELSFTYTPQLQPSSFRQPKYGDVGTTEILTRQYPPLFHAATNVPAFIQAFSAFVNLEQLHVSCPGYDHSQKYRRSIVDFALISLRIAVERNCLNALDTLSLSPIHPGGLLYLSPLLGFGATPNSARRWSRIKHLTIHADTPSPTSPTNGEPDQFRLLQTYLHNFQRSLQTFIFRWNGDKGPLPLLRPVVFDNHAGEHPAHASPTFQRSADTRPSITRTRSVRPLHFPRIQRLEIENVSAKASDISSLIATHKHTLDELDLKHIELTEGTWDDAFTPLNKPKRRSHRPSPAEVADIPIMLSPSTSGSPCRGSGGGGGVPMDRVEVAPQQHEGGGRRSLGMSRWLDAAGAKRKTCEEGLKKVFRSGVFTSWK